MTNFTKAVKIAKVLEGNWSARIALAWKMIKEEQKENGEKYSINEVNTLINLETFEPIAQPEAMPAIQEEAMETLPAVNTSVPVNVLAVFGQNAYDTIQTIVNNFMTHDRTKEKMLLLEDGLNALQYVETYKELTGTVIAYFLQSYTKIIIRKILAMGVNYKKLNNTSEATNIHRNSYQNASSNAGNIITHEVDDLFNELVADAFRLTFDKGLFENITFVYPAIRLRVTNIMKKELRRMRKQTKVYFDDAVKFIDTFEAQNHDSVKFTLQMIENAKFLNADEKRLLKLKVAGYEKKEVYAELGRVDRKFKSMETKLEEQAGQTLKAVKAEAEAERKAIKEKAKKSAEELKEKAIAEAEAIENMEIHFNAIEYKIGEVVKPAQKELKPANIDMIDEALRMAKFK